MTKITLQVLEPIFSRVHKRYDLVNRVMSLGMDQRWRRQVARHVLGARPSQVLDLCCGTGDLSLMMAQMARGMGVRITAADFSEGMLETAKLKARRAERRGCVVEEKKEFLNINWIKSDAAKLPFKDGHFDAVTNSFGFRNLIHGNPLARDHLKEIRRVLRPGGQFVTVETSQPSSRIMRLGYHAYLRFCAEPIGTLFTGDREAFRYFSRSATAFLDPNGVEDLLTSAGFENFSAKPLMFGAVCVYSVTRKNCL